MIESLILNEFDNKVESAREAENQLRQHFHLKGIDHTIHLKAFDIDIRVCEYGEGNPLLIVPGNTGDSFVFMPLIAQISRCRILALNRPGGGLSEGFDHHSAPFKQLAIETLDAVLEYFHLNSVPIMAHSMGSHWSLWYAIERPQRVERLALLGVPGNVLSCKPPMVLRLTSIPWLNRVLFSMASSKSASNPLQGLKMMGHSKKTLDGLPQAMADCYYHFQRLPHYEKSSLSLMEVTNTLFGSKKDIRIDRAALRKIKAPTLLVWGENDPFGSAEIGRQIAQSIPQAEFSLIHNGGHLPWLDEPQKCGEMVMNFLNVPLHKRID